MPVGCPIVVGMTFGAMRFSGILGRDGLSAESVDGMRHRLEMGRIYTRTIPAKVVDLLAWRYRTMMKFPRNAMRATHAPPHANPAVTIGAAIRLP